MQLCLIAFVLMISICLNLYATETEIIPENHEVFDEIHPEDMEIQEIVEEERETQDNQYAIWLIVIFVINLIFVLHKIGINRKIIILFFGTIGGMLLSIVSLFLFNQLNIFQRAIHYRFVIMATFGMCLYVSFYVITNLEEMKNKTEDIFWKKVFINGIQKAKNNIFNMINIIFLSYSGIAMLFLDAKVITKEMICISISGSIGIIVSILITAFLYAIFNSQKTIYKTTSKNKLNGQRSLKL